MRKVLWLLQKLPLQHFKAVRYIISGGSAAAVNFILLWVFTEFLGLWYLLSLIIASIISASLTFALQKFWTFENPSMERVHVQMPQYVALALINLALNSAALYVLVEYAHMWYLAGQVICSAVLAVMNFLINQHYIFRPHKES